MFASGQIRPVIDTVLPLDQAPEAHRMLAESRAFGRSSCRSRLRNGLDRQHGHRPGQAHDRGHDVEHRVAAQRGDDRRGDDRREHLRQRVGDVDDLRSRARSTAAGNTCVISAWSTARYQP